MTVRKLDESGDITTSGRQFISEREEIAQTVSTRLKLFLGEYFRDINDGTPWWEQVLGKPKSLSAAEAAIKNRIIRTEGVVKLIFFKTDYKLGDRAYTVSCGILTTFGETQLNLNLEV